MINTLKIVAMHTISATVRMLVAGMLVAITNCVAIVAKRAAEPGPKRASAWSARAKQAEKSNGSRNENTDAELERGSPGQVVDVKARDEPAVVRSHRTTRGVRRGGSGHRETGVAKRRGGRLPLDP